MKTKPPPPSQPALKESRAAEKLNRVKSAEALGRARRACWKALPDIVDALIEKALKGEMSHIKLLLELGGLDRGALAVQTRQSKKKKPFDMLDAWLKQEADRKAAAEAEAAQPQTEASLNLVGNLQSNINPNLQTGDAYDA